MVHIKELSISELYKYEKSILCLIRDALISSFPDGDISASLCNEKFEELVGHMKRQSATVFGAISEAELVGWLWCHRIDRLEKQFLHIAFFSVLTEFKCRGIGRLLIETAEYKAKTDHLAGIDLLVTASNDEAVGFYSYFGYEPQRYLMSKTV